MKTESRGEAPERVNEAIGRSVACPKLFWAKTKPNQAEPNRPERETFPAAGPEGAELEPRVAVRNFD